MKKRNSYRKTLGLLFCASSLAIAAMACSQELPSEDSMKEAKIQNQEGIRALQASHFDQALTLFQKASELDTVTPDYPNNVGIVYLNQNQLEKARQAFQEAIRRNEQYGRAYYNLGVAYQQDGMYEEAAAAYTQALSIDPSEFVAKYNLALVLMRAGHLKEAREAFRNFLTMAPEALGKPRADAQKRIDEITQKLGDEKKNEKE